MNEPSLFKRLLFSLSALLLVLIFVSYALIYQSIGDHLDKIRDAELVNSSHTLLSLAKDKLARKPDGSIDLQATLSQHPDWRAFRVWKGNTLLLQSDNAVPKDMPKARPDFSEKNLGTEPWRTYALYVQEEDIVVEVSENLLSRRLLVRSIFEGFLASSALLLPLLALLLFLCIRYGLKGLTDMERMLEERGPESLDHIRVDTIPKELKPLQRSINFLLEKLHRKITEEKQLIDNAAHELRTPLAALKLHAQLASGATNDKDRGESMNDLFSTLDSTTAMVEQLLALSRLATERVTLLPVSLYAAAEKAVRERKATAKPVKWIVTGDTGTRVHSDEKLLGILLGVLLDNAAKFSPDNEIVMIAVEANMMDISDNGPGIPMAEREKVFERFYRANRREPGHGLGLAIARQICALLHIAIALEDAPGGGLRVRLAFENVL